LECWICFLKSEEQEEYVIGTIQQELRSEKKLSSKVRVVIGKIQDNKEMVNMLRMQRAKTKE